MDEALRCPKCNLLLGFHCSDEVRIKWRDFYVILQFPTWIKVACRRCGAVNVIYGEEVPRVPPSAKTDVDWLCTNCHHILGKFAADGMELRMKCRDLYISIGEAERVVTLCRKCGTINTVGSTNQAGVP